VAGLLDTIMFKRQQADAQAQRAMAAPTQSTEPAPLPMMDQVTQAPLGITDEQATMANRGFVGRQVEAGVYDVKSGLESAMAATAQALGKDPVAMRQQAQESQRHAEKVASPDHVSDLRNIGGLGDTLNFAAGHALRGAPMIGTMAAGAGAARVFGAPALAGAAAGSMALNTGEIYGQGNESIDEMVRTGQVTPEKEKELRGSVLRDSAIGGALNAVLDTGAFGFIFKANPIAKGAMAKMLSPSLMGHVGRSVLAEGGTEALQEYISIAAQKHALENPEMFGLTQDEAWQLANAGAAGASMAAPLAPIGHVRRRVGDGLQAGEDAVFGGIKKVFGPRDEGVPAVGPDGAPLPPAPVSSTFDDVKSFVADGLRTLGEIPAVAAALEKGGDFIDAIKADKRYGKVEHFLETNAPIVKQGYDSFVETMGAAAAATPAAYERYKTLLSATLAKNGITTENLRSLSAAGGQKLTEAVQTFNENLPAMKEQAASVFNTAKGVIRENAPLARSAAGAAINTVKDVVQENAPLARSAAGAAINTVKDVVQENAPLARSAAGAAINTATGVAQEGVRAARTFKASIQEAKDAMGGIVSEMPTTETPGVKQSKAGALSKAALALRNELLDATELDPKDISNGATHMVKRLDTMLKNNPAEFDAFINRPSIAQYVATAFDMSPSEFKDLVVRQIGAIKEERGARRSKVEDNANFVTDANQSNLDGNADSFDAIDEIEKNLEEDGGASALTEIDSANETGVDNPALDPTTFAKMVTTGRQAGTEINPKTGKKWKPHKGNAWVQLTYTTKDSATGEVVDTKTTNKQINFVNVATSWKDHTLSNSRKGVQQSMYDNFKQGVTGLLTGWQETDDAGNDVVVTVDPAKQDTQDGVVSAIRREDGIGGKGRFNEVDMKSWLRPNSVVSANAGKLQTYDRLTYSSKENRAPNVHTAVEDFHAKVAKQSEPEDIAAEKARQGDKVAREVVNTLRDSLKDSRRGTPFTPEEQQTLVDRAHTFIMNPQAYGDADGAIKAKVHPALANLSPAVFSAARTSLMTRLSDLELDLQKGQMGEQETSVDNVDKASNEEFTGENEGVLTEDLSGQHINYEGTENAGRGYDAGAAKASNARFANDKVPVGGKARKIAPSSTAVAPTTDLPGVARATIAQNAEKEDRAAERELGPVLPLEPFAADPGVVSNDAGAGESASNVRDVALKNVKAAYARVTTDTGRALLQNAMNTLVSDRRLTDAQMEILTSPNLTPGMVKDFARVGDVKPAGKLEKGVDGPFQRREEKRKELTKDANEVPFVAKNEVPSTEARKVINLAEEAVEGVAPKKAEPNNAELLKPFRISTEHAEVRDGGVYTKDGTKLGLSADKKTFVSLDLTGAASSQAVGVGGRVFTIGDDTYVVTRPLDGEGNPRKDAWIVSEALTGMVANSLRQSTIPAAKESATDRIQSAMAGTSAIFPALKAIRGTAEGQAAKKAEPAPAPAEGVKKSLHTGGRYNQSDAFKALVNEAAQAVAETQARLNAESSPAATTALEAAKTVAADLTSAQPDKLNALQLDTAILALRVAIKKGAKGNGEAQALSAAQKVLAAMVPITPEMAVAAKKIISDSLGEYVKVDLAPIMETEGPGVLGVYGASRDGGESIGLLTALYDQAQPEGALYETAHHEVMHAVLNRISSEYGGEAAKHLFEAAQAPHIASQVLKNLPLDSRDYFRNDPEEMLVQAYALWRAGKLKLNSASKLGGFFNGVKQFVLDTLARLRGDDLLAEVFGAVERGEFRTTEAPSFDSLLRGAAANKEAAKGFAPNSQPDIADRVDSTDPAVQAELVAAIHKIAGATTGVKFDANQAHAGQYDAAKKLITLAATSALSGSTAFHEAFHVVYRNYLTSDQRKSLYAAFKGGPVKAQLKELLKDSPDAWEAATMDEEELMAYSFQFWHNGALKVGPDTSKIMGKIAALLQKAIAWVKDQPTAQELLEQIRDGVFADGPPSPVDIALAKQGRTGNAARQVLASAAKGMGKLYDKALSTYDDRARELGNPHTSKLARLMYTQVGEKTTQRGFAQAEPEAAKRFLNKLAKLAASPGYQQGLEDRAAGVESPAAAAIGAYLDSLQTYLWQAGVDVGYIEDYLPMSWSGDKILAQKKAFIDMFAGHSADLDKLNAELAAKATNPKFDPLTPESIWERMSKRGLDATEFSGEAVDENGVPNADFVLNRVFGFLSNAEKRPFVRDDLASSLQRYTKQAVRRAEWARRFGDKNEIWDAEMEAARGYTLSAEDEDLMKSYKDDALGTKLHDLSPTMRKVIAGVTVYQNYRVLGLALLGSVVDPMGIAVRSGEWREATQAYKTAISRLTKKGRLKAAEMEALAETIGAIESSGVADSLTNLYGGVDIEGVGKTLNDKLFTWNGMNGLMRSVRIAALAAGTRFLVRHSKNGEEGTRHLAELGIEANDVKTDGNGQLVVTDKVAAALNRFVDESSMRPNIGERTKWGADPTFALLYHLKQYVFSFNKVINKKFEHELLEHGNPTPMLMAMTYIPIMAASTMLRDMIYHGGSIPDKNGFLHYMGRGLDRSGLLGPTAFTADAVRGVVGADQFLLRGLIGPTADQALDAFGAVANPRNGAQFAEFVAESLPLGSVVSKAIR